MYTFAEPIISLYNGKKKKYFNTLELVEDIEISDISKIEYVTFSSDYSKLFLANKGLYEFFKGIHEVKGVIINLSPDE